MGLAANDIIRQATDTGRHGEVFTIDGGTWALLCEAHTAGSFHLEGRAAADGAAWSNVTATAITATGMTSVELIEAMQYRVSGNNGNVRGAFRLLPTVAGQGGPIAA